MIRPMSCRGLLLGTLVLGSCSEAGEPVGASAEPEAASLTRASAAPVGDQHLFVLRGGTSAAEVGAAVAAAGGTVLYSMDEIGVVWAKGLSGAAAAAVGRGRADVAQDASALWIPKPNPTLVQAFDEGAAGLPGAASIREPETALFYRLGFQWNMEITDTDDAWLRQYDGVPNVEVAILDTGLDPYHQDAMGLIDMARSRAFVPSLTGPPEWQDDNFHGTHVGGIVTTNNFGVAGVAPDVTLVAVKVLANNGSGSFGAVVAGIYYAASIGVDVINMSLGAYLPRNGNTALLVAALNRAVNYAHARDVFVVASAGNEARNLQQDQNLIAVPCETGVLSCISATGPADLPAYYTNFGTNAINNAAPGGDETQPDRTGPPGPTPLGFVLSLCTTRAMNPDAPSLTLACRARDTPSGPVGTRYVFAAGTSMAAPHISGLGAYLDSQYGGTLNGSQILTEIQRNADDLGKPGADAFYGKGRMNTCRTLPGCAESSPSD